MKPLLIHILILTFLALLAATHLHALPACGAHRDRGAGTLEVLHAHGPCSPLRPAAAATWDESVRKMQAGDAARVRYLSGLAAARKSVVPIASGRQIVQSPTYIVRVRVGTPPQTLLMAMDTSNDAAWVPSDGCVGCSSAASAAFSPAKSTTFKPVPCSAPQCKQVPNPTCNASACSFNMTYGGSSISADVSQDTFTLATDPIPAYTFGCIQKAAGSSVPRQGLLGLGRGPLSLLSQSQSLYQSTFSYCLPSFKALNFSGSLRLGPIGQPKRIKYTPLLKNPRRSSLYYVQLVGIKVGGRPVVIPPPALEFNPTTGSGTIIDSGTVFTRLVAPAYTAVRDEFRRRMGTATVSSLGGFDTCYSVPIVVPTITFMFQGMNVTLPQDNFLIHSSSGSLTCLALASAPENVNSVLNVIANMQQQNHRLLFDVPNSRLGVARETCS